MAAMNSAVHTVFVYGTLLRGEPNHRFLVSATWLGEACTKAEFELVDLGYFPALVASGQAVVFGEIYSVDQATLHKLDRLEGHPDLYRRTTIELSDGRQADTYIFPKEHTRGRPRIASGNWRTRGM